MRNDNICRGMTQPYFCGMNNNGDYVILPRSEVTIQDDKQDGKVESE